VEVQPRHSVVLRCKQCADRHPQRAATLVGDASVVRDRRGRWVIRIREARAARRTRVLATRRRRRETASSGSEASFHCHACRATLTVARDRLQAAFAADCDSVLVGANGEIVLTYW
jgi:sarcosine oxidase delta subunit